MAQGPIDSSVPGLSPQAPNCPACGKRMRLERLQPDPRYNNLDRYFFACSCRQSTDILVARNG